MGFVVFNSSAKLFKVLSEQNHNLSVSGQILFIFKNEIFFTCLLPCFESPLRFFVDNLCLFESPSSSSSATPTSSDYRCIDADQNRAEVVNWVISSLEAVSSNWHKSCH
ncbi:hypothetical protein DM860_016133 [Cuscuta australis]|uniref:Uncharacterized protein n=1 Tax=Cuscuta australis TaxID=267555 RepID=A0A328E2P0_9ASTE|nr:hypothetical protein DM860_016133 [Cuscuta australis]